MKPLSPPLEGRLLTIRPLGKSHPTSYLTIFLLLNIVGFLDFSFTAIINSTILSTFMGGVLNLKIFECSDYMFLLKRRNDLEHLKSMNESSNIFEKFGGFSKHGHISICEGLAHVLLLHRNAVVFMSVLR